MTRLLFILVLIALPGSALAEENAPLFVSGDRVLISSSTPSNVYVGAGTVAVTTPIAGDLVAFGGSIIIDASVGGDTLLAAGSIEIGASLEGDARLAGGSITLREPVTGNLVAAGGSIEHTGGGADNVFIVGADVSVTGGAEGPVQIYGNTVTLGGTFTHDVEIVASGRFTVLPEAVIEGQLRYQAPQEAIIAESAIIAGGVEYTGASYLPTTEEARAIALASFGVFLFVKILGVLVLAGLFAGLFPEFTERAVLRARETTMRHAFLALLLGFGVIVATPVLLFLLSVTFVGLGLAFILLLAYLLLIALAFIYAGITCGSYLARYLFKRELQWSDAVLGMLAFFVIWSIPGIGWYVVALATTYMIGVLTLIAYRFAFSHGTLKELED